MLKATIRPVETKRGAELREVYFGRVKRPGRLLRSLQKHTRGPSMMRLDVEVAVQAQYNSNASNTSTQREYSKPKG